MHSQDTTNSAHLATDAQTMHLNVFKAIAENSFVSLGFRRKQSDTDLQTT